MHVRIKNLKNNREFAANFDTREECENWVRSHKHKGADEKILFSPHVLDGSEVLGEQKSPFGTTYKLKIPAEYTVEYLEHNPDDVKGHWQNLSNKRKEILAETDWTQLADVPLTTDERRMYREYRDYVRKIKTQYADDSIHRWHIKDFKEWKNWKHYDK